jgi:multicomponent Na+:H+ antiporter subunit D
MQPTFVLIPLAALLLANLPVGRVGKKLAYPLAIALAALQVLACLFLPAELLAAPAALFGSGPGLESDSLSRLLLLCVGIVSLASLSVGYGGFERGDARHRFSNLIIVSLAGMNGVALVRDLFSLYVFLEIAAVGSYVLIAFDRDRDALEGSFKYLVLSAVASFMMLCSIALFLLVAGGTSFALVAAALAGAAGGGGWLPPLAAALFAGGLCIKSGLVPFHGWLPDAYSSAPPAVSVLLAGIVTKTTGVYSLMRIASVFGLSFKLDSALVWLGLLSIVVGALAALGQKDIKRMLAYSSLSQVGYIVLGVGTGSPLGVAAAAFHLFNHAIFKTQLFVNAAAVERQAGTRNLEEMGGLSKEMPITSWSSVVAFLSAAGVPPLAGFWSKLLVVVAAWQAGLVPAAAAAALASILTLAYFLVLQRKAFFGKPGARPRPVAEAPFWLTAPAIALALVSLGVGILFPLVVDSLILPIARIP